MEVMFSNNINNKYFDNHSFIGFVGEDRDLSTIIYDIKYTEYKPNNKVKSLLKGNKYIDMLLKREDLFKCRIRDLSESESKLVKLLDVCNRKPSLVILNNFDLGFNYKDKSKISKFIKTMNAEYKTNFIIISNDIVFLRKNIKHLIISKNKIIKYQGDLISAVKQGLIEKPPIVNFIELANKKDANLKLTLDNKELLKDIYRSVF